MTPDEILVLQRKNYEQQLEHELARMRHENKQEAINLSVFIISEQMKANTMLMFRGILK